MSLSALLIDINFGLCVVSGSLPHERVTKLLSSSWVTVLGCHYPTQAEGSEDVNWGRVVSTSVSRHQVHNLLRNLNIRMSTGLDEMHPSVLGELADVGYLKSHSCCLW